MGRHRKPGRPKGSKNKPGHKAGRPRKGLSGAIARARSLDESEFRRLRGRPKGSHKHVTVHGVDHKGMKVTIVGILKRG